MADRHRAGAGVLREAQFRRYHIDRGAVTTAKLQQKFPVLHLVLDSAPCKTKADSKSRLSAANTAACARARTPPVVGLKTSSRRHR